MPSSSVSTWLTTRWVTPLSPPPPLAGTKLSISSKNRMQGEACLALRNTSRMPFSDAPTHWLSSSGPFTEMKLTLLS